MSEISFMRSISISVWLCDSTLQDYSPLNKDLQVQICQTVILYFLLCEIMFANSISISICLTQNFQGLFTFKQVHENLKLSSIQILRIQTILYCIDETFRGWAWKRNFVSHLFFFKIGAVSWLLLISFLIFSW